MTVFLRRSVDWLSKVWPLIPAALYLIGFLIVVLLYLIGLGFSDPRLGAVFPSVKPFAVLFSDRNFMSALVNTMLFVAIGTPLELVSGLVLAMLVYRSFRFRNLVQSFLLIPLAIPALVTAMLLFILFDFPGGHINHLLMGKYVLFPEVIHAPVSWRGNQFFAMAVSMLGKVWRDTPISMLILLAGLNAIDPELFDAAKSMGASLRVRLQKVILPLIIPSMSAVVLLRSVEMWKEFIFPFVLAGRHHLLGTLIDFFYNDMGNSNRAATVALVLVAGIVTTTLLFLVAMDLLNRAMSRR